MKQRGCNKKNIIEKSLDIFNRLKIWQKDLYPSQNKITKKNYKNQ